MVGRDSEEERDVGLGMWSSRFLDPRLEGTFGLTQLSSLKRKFWTAWVLLLVGNLLFLRSDWALFGASVEFERLLTTRVFYVGFSSVLAIVVARTRSPDTIHRVSFIWGLCSVGTIMLINSTRPPLYVDHVMVDLLSVMLFYVVMPLTLTQQLTLGLLYTGVALGVVAAAKIDASPLRGHVVWATFLLTNLACAITSRRSHRSSRIAFNAMERAHEKTARLTEALAEVQALRGIVPICAHCKNVRDDEGYWSEVEVYVSARTGADFSHGICPRCLGEHYPKFASSDDDSGE